VQAGGLAVRAGSGGGVAARPAAPDSVTLRRLDQHTG
jgi:hypothetical protein